MTTKALVQTLKDNDQDHEFYPTTNEIIKRMISDMKCPHYVPSDDPKMKIMEWRYERHRGMDGSILDIGAGNGKVLRAVKQDDELHIRTLMAIEKSTILCQQLGDDVLIVGTDFEQQSLFSKPAEYVFSNPPYSVFEEWANKIIRQASCLFAYLVIPQRWEQSQVIKDALTWREAQAVKIGEFDFENSEDRTARAKVHLVRIDMPAGGDDDAFERFFKTEFFDLHAKFMDAPVDDDESDKKDKAAKFGHLVVGPSYPEALVSLYNGEMDKIRANYRSLSQLDAALLKEFDMNPKKVMKGLQERLKNLKAEYWNELFNRLDKITSRLCSKQRNRLLGTLQRHADIDFTYNNILAIVIWVINNSNKYLEEQLIDTYEEMVAKCNVVLYKSNKKVWVEDHWRYSKDENPNSHYALDYRIVIHRVGSIDISSFGDVNRHLCQSASDFLGDLLTVANNLGFTTLESGRNKLGTWGCSYSWTPGALVNFFKTDGEQIFDVRAFKNRNMHIRLNKEFICALNVEYGRLKGWLKTPAQAVEELGDPEAAKYFETNHKLTLNTCFLLTQGAQDEEEEESTVLSDDALLEAIGAKEQEAVLQS